MSISRLSYNSLSSLTLKQSKVKSTETSSTEKSSLEKTITEMAKKDATKGEYMGSEFAAFRRAYVNEAAPNRSLAISQVSRFMRNEDGYNLIDGINRWVSTLLGIPYKAEGVNGPMGENTAQVYNQNGEMIASYHWANGWTSVPTSAETTRSHELRFMYYNAYHKAREAMKTEVTSNSKITSGTLFNAKA